MRLAIGVQSVQSVSFPSTRGGPSWWPARVRSPSIVLFLETRAAAPLERLRVTLGLLRRRDVLLALEKRELATQRAPALQTCAVELTVCDGRQYRAIRFRLVHAVREATAR